MYERLFKEAQTFKRQIVGVEEIKKDRDERVGNLRNEIDQIQGQLDKLTTEHAALRVRAKSIEVCLPYLAHSNGHRIPRGHKVTRSGGRVAQV